MRKFLLASVATLGTGGLTGAALAQNPPGAPVPAPLSAPAPMAGTIGAPTQGQQAWSPAPAPTAYVNNNNNYQAPALPGALANPTPARSSSTSMVRCRWTHEALFGQSVGITTASPQRGRDRWLAGAPRQQRHRFGKAAAAEHFNIFARLYAGGDGMATNGLRYGAAIEIRQNFTGQASNNGSSGASG